MSSPHQPAKNPESLPCVEGYEILALVGRGGMSVVYKAHQTAFNRVVAVKMLHPHLISSTSSLQRFMQEGRLAVGLQHENIATTYAIATTAEAIPFLVMEYLYGQSLDVLIADQQVLDLTDFKSLFVQILNGLSYAHKAGIIHRDIKPSNIVVVKPDAGITSEEEKLTGKIVDFGVAKLIEQKNSEQKLTRTGAIVGSPAYMSPEQWAGQALDARSDIYSLGCVMYRALTGKLPHSTDNPFEYMTRHMKQEVLPPSHSANRALPQGLDAVVLKMMQKDKQLRYASCDEVLQDFCALDFNCLIAPAKSQAVRNAEVHGNLRPNKKILIASVSLLAVIALSLLITTLPTSEVQSVSLAQKLFACGKYSEASKTLDCKPPLRIDRLSKEEQSQLLQLEYLLCQALHDDADDGFNTMRRLLRSQAVLVPAAGTYGQLIDANYLKTGESLRLANISPDRTNKYDQYLQSLIHSQKALMAQRRGDVTEALREYAEARAAAVRSNRPERELEVLNLVIAHYLSARDRQRAELTAVVVDAHRVAGRLMPVSGYTCARAVADLAASTNDWSELRKSSQWVAKIEGQQSLPKRVQARIAFVNGRVLEGRGRLLDAAEQYERVCQFRAAIPPVWEGEALVRAGSCSLDQANQYPRGSETQKQCVHRAVSDFEKAIPVLSEIYGDDPQAQNNRVFLSNRIGVLAALDKRAAADLTRRQAERYTTDCKTFASNLEESPQLRTDVQWLQGYARHFQRGLELMLITGNYSDALIVAKNRLHALELLCDERIGADAMALVGAEARDEDKDLVKKDALAEANELVETKALIANLRKKVNTLEQNN